MRIGGNELPDLSFGPTWVTVLSLVPFFFNLLILLFVAFKGARTKLNFSFVLFLLVLCSWQLTESFGRTSLTMEGAAMFVKISLYPMLFIPVFGTMFILRLSGQTRVVNSPIFFIAYFVLPILTGFILITETYEYELIRSSIFQWTSTPSRNIPTLLFFSYIIITCGGMVFFVWRAYFRTDLHHYHSSQISLLAWGFSIPVILGIVTEILLPVFTDSEAFPLANISVLSFSLASMYALYTSKIFLSVPKHEWKYILDHMDDGIVIVNDEMQIRYANRKASRILETKRSQLPDLDLKKSIAQSGIDLVRLTAERPAVVKSEFNLLTGKERTRRVKATFRVFNNRENNSIETLIILADVHNLRKAEAESHLKSQQLSSFLYRTSHDLKNPVVCIEGLLTLYREGSSEEKEKCIDLIEVSNNRIKNILHSMAAVTKFNQHQTQIVPLKVNDLIIQVKSKLQEMNSPLEIVTNIEDHTIIHSDSVLLQFIFTELAVNADRFRRPLIQHPVLEIQHIRNYNQDRLIFSDNGIGIPEKVSGELFGIFFRGHLHSGTGMGLYSVKWICDKLGYQITYSKSDDGRTSFSVTIPRAETLNDSMNQDSVGEESFAEALSA